jgi:hypothetical protein
MKFCPEGLRMIVVRLGIIGSKRVFFAKRYAKNIGAGVLCGLWRRNSLASAEYVGDKYFCSRQ